MSWALVLTAGVVAIAGVLIVLNAAALSTGIRSTQDKYMGPWTPPRDEIDRPGLFGPITERQRAWSMRAVGVVALVIAVGFGFLAFQ